MNQVAQNMIGDADRLEEPCSDAASRHDPAGTLLESPSTCNEPPPADADAPPCHEDEMTSDLAIRERLIEWLVGFLPNGTE